MVLNSQIFIFGLLINTIWLIILSILLYKAKKIYCQLTSGISKKDFAAVLVQIKQQLKNTDKDLSDIETALKKVNTKLKTHIQKLGFMRYNPFGNTGGDQSFCVCFLDSSNNGIMITSLHTRNQTRIYSKQIKDGRSQENAKLSKEEARCIKKAINWSKQ